MHHRYSGDLPSEVPLPTHSCHSGQERKFLENSAKMQEFVPDYDSPYSGNLRKDAYLKSVVFGM